MGLEIVELVIAAEEEFGVKLPDEIIAKWRTVGQMRDEIVDQLESTGERPDPQDVLERLYGLIVGGFGVKADSLSPETRFIQDLDFG